VMCVRKWDPDILGGYEVIQLKIIHIIFSTVSSMQTILSVWVR